MAHVGVGESRLLKNTLVSQISRIWLGVLVGGANKDTFTGPTLPLAKGGGMVAFREASDAPFPLDFS